MKSVGRKVSYGGGRAGAVAVRKELEEDGVERLSASEAGGRAAAGADRQLNKRRVRLGRRGTAIFWTLDGRAAMDGARGWPGVRAGARCRTVASRAAVSRALRVVRH